MIIVNADDWGRDRSDTDAALACYERGRLCSASAMVFMSDSERAAEVAEGVGIDVGLHVNFSEGFTDAKVDPRVQEAHNKVRRFLHRSKYALLLYNPLLCQEFAVAYQAQWEEFARLYKRPPSHIDGHQHMHLATNVLAQRLLPVGARVRRSFSFRAREKGFVNRLYRRAVDRILAGRYRITDYFFALSQHRSIERLGLVMDLAVESVVELMTHPRNPMEYEILMSDRYVDAVSRVHLARHDSF